MSVGNAPYFFRWTPVSGSGGDSGIPPGAVRSCKKMACHGMQARVQRCYGLGVGVLKLCVFFPETLDTACRIHKFLLPGEEWVALGTDFHANVLFRGSHFNGIPASAAYSCLVVLRMDLAFHGVNVPSMRSLSLKSLYYHWFLSFYQEKIRWHPQDSTMRGVFSESTRG